MVEHRTIEELSKLNVIAGMNEVEIKRLIKFYLNKYGIKHPNFNDVNRIEELYFKFVVDSTPKKQTVNEMFDQITKSYAKMMKELIETLTIHTFDNYY